MRRFELEEHELARVVDVAFGLGKPLRVFTALDGEVTFTLGGVGEFTSLDDVETALAAIEVPR